RRSRRLGRRAEADDQAGDDVAALRTPAHDGSVPHGGGVGTIEWAGVRQSGCCTNMASKTSMPLLVRAFDWKAVDAGLSEKPQLVTHRDERGRNWLHVCCATSLDGRDPRPSIRTADVLLAHGIDVQAHAFTEGRWRATPVWYCVSFGRNLKLAEHLIKRGASPQYSLYAAAYNRDADAIRLLVRYGADIEEQSGPGDTPLLGAIGWSHFEAAAAMLAC